MNYRDLDDFSPLLEILCCPYSKASLALVSLSELKAVLPKSESEKVLENTSGAMVSNVSKVAFPIIGSVVSFKEEHELKLSQEESDSNAFQPENEAAQISKTVQQWYDEFGWQRNSAGVYHDSSIYSSGSDYALRYYELNSHLSLLPNLMGGKFVLDAASGAIAHPEYLSYSWYYDWRVCVDLSMTGLNEAAKKIGKRGFCCLANIANLPFKDNVFDGIVSGYTVQHIPEANQKKAVSELYRVLKPGKACQIMTRLRIGTAGRRARKILKLIGKTPKTSVTHTNTEHEKEKRAELYGKSQTADWWKSLASELGSNFEMRTLRVMDDREFNYYIGNSAKKTQRLRLLESVFPRLLSRVSHYGLLVLNKPSH